jgi:ferredoxin-type protein NapH
VSMLLKLTSRMSLRSIGGEASLCTERDACIKICPMDIRIPEYMKNNQLLLSTECSLCQTCVAVCAPNALKLTFGFDLGGKEYLRNRMS